MFVQMVSVKPTVKKKCKQYCWTKALVYQAWTLTFRPIEKWCMYKYTTLPSTP